MVVMRKGRVASCRSCGRPFQSRGGRENCASCESKSALVPARTRAAAAAEVVDSEDEAPLARAVVVTQTIAEDEVECPRCAETIKARAKVCRYCQHDLTTDAAPPRRGVRRARTTV